MPAGVTGLYHLALWLPDRSALAKILRRLSVSEVPLQGAADHGVSQALYLADPDGHGLPAGAPIRQMKEPARMAQARASLADEKTISSVDGRTGDQGRA